MAKGKTFTYVLITCVAAVWGLIVYRVYAGMSEDGALPPIAKSVKVPYFKLVDHQNDQVKLELGYRDPFAVPNSVEGSPRERAEPTLGLPRNSQPQRQHPPQKPQVNWATVQYTGYVHNPDSKQRRVLIAINGNTILLKEGESVQGLKLLKNFGDSLKVQYQGEIKFINIK